MKSDDVRIKCDCGTDIVLNRQKAKEIQSLHQLLEHDINIIEV